MAEFKKIETQEEFDAAIGERLKRERESVEKEFGEKEKDLKSRLSTAETKASDLNKQLDEINKKYAGTDKTIEELQAKCAKYESDSVKTRVALELGLPYGLASRITGEDEDSIRKDAENLLSMVGKGKTPPGKNPEAGEDGSAMKNLLRSLTKGE